jgi:hypothetical protein
MRKIIIVLAIVACVVGLCSSVFAQTQVQSVPVPHLSTNVVASTVIATAPPTRVVYAIKACSNATNACSCTLYDSANSTTSNQRNYAGVSAGNYEPNGDLIPTTFLYGIYVVPSGTGCSCQVWWQ